MSEREGIPLRIGEAWMVADQIRKSNRVDKNYWPFVVEELCKMLEKAQVNTVATETIIANAADAILDEREACAKVVESLAAKEELKGWHQDGMVRAAFFVKVAQAIRGRGK